jgi:hypothetical protein
MPDFQAGYAGSIPVARSAQCYGKAACDLDTLRDTQ